MRSKACVCGLLEYSTFHCEHSWRNCILRLRVLSDSAPMLCIGAIRSICLSTCGGSEGRRHAGREERRGKEHEREREPQIELRRPRGGLPPGRGGVRTLTKCWSSRS